MLDYILNDLVGKVHEASTLFSKMQEEGIQPGQVGWLWWPYEYLYVHFLILILCTLSWDHYLVGIVQGIAILLRVYIIYILILQF